MIKKIPPTLIWSCIVMTALFLTAVLCRPLLPVDETRYMTVAWEMRLNDGWLAPLTLNFEPYSHKPPMLFWLINMFWSVFGISRWAGLIPVALVSLSCLLLTIRLGRKLLPPETFDPLRILFLMLGSVPFFIYSTLVMFDMTMMMFVLCALLCLVEYATTRQFRHMFLLGIVTGLALLTKGPVAWLYIIFPMLLGPFWVQGFTKPLSWYGDCFAGLLISIFPLLVWLVPVLSVSDNHFAFWLVWEQTAGRIAGNFNAAHVRPFYFYLPLLLLFFAPWIFFPAFWQGMKQLDKQNLPVRFLLCWIVPVFICFSLISGKQPHYLLPLLPGGILLTALLLQSLPVKKVREAALMILLLGMSGQVFASVKILKNYDLQPIASYVQTSPDTEWAWVRNYHGEIGFLGRIKKPVTNLSDIAQIDPWFAEHPHGKAIIRYDDEKQVDRYTKIMSVPYRGKQMGIFTRP